MLATADQLEAEKLVTQIANSPIMQLAKVVLKAGWWLAAKKNFAAVGGPDAANMAQLDQAVTEYANQAAIEVLLLNSNNPKILQQVNPARLVSTELLRRTDLVRQPRHDLPLRRGEHRVEVRHHRTVRRGTAGRHQLQRAQG